MESFKIQSTFKVNPEILYNAWLDSRIHTEMSGADSQIDPEPNGSFNIWNGYITGTTLELVKNRKIVQKWRTTDFPLGSDHSVIEIVFKTTPSGTKLMLWHYNIPDGQGKDYKDGWKQYYFKPMKEYFKSL
jgi:activator of HSP90 ATPase